MSADFWAGYISGVVGIIAGNPLDVLKVRLQSTNPGHVSRAKAQAKATAACATVSRLHAANFCQLGTSTALAAGTAAPIIGYGGLNALLFMTYNRTESLFSKTLPVQTSLWPTWLAGAAGGLATWVISAPTELIKCRAQLSEQSASSWAIAKEVLRTEGIHGLYFGGTVTALRDSIGYGFYFWSYELSRHWLSAKTGADDTPEHEMANVLLCGGLAGVVTWASVFPLDVVKTRVQTQPAQGAESPQRLGALLMARKTYHEGGLRIFFRGLTVCSARAFIVNAAQWAVYEWVMRQMGQGKQRHVETAKPTEM